MKDSMPQSTRELYSRLSEVFHIEKVDGEVFSRREEMRIDVEGLLEPGISLIGTAGPRKRDSHQVKRVQIFRRLL